MSNAQVEKSLQTLNSLNTSQNYSTSSNKPPTSTTIMHDDLLEGYSTTTSSSSSSDSIKSHPLYNAAKSKLAEGLNVLPIPDKLKVNPSNASEVRTLITATDGVLYSDSNIQIEYKSTYQGPLGKIALQIVSKGAALSKINLTIPNTANLFFNVSPVKYADNSQVMAQVMNIGPGIQLPKASMTFNQGDAYRNIEFEFPVAVNKFCSPVDMPTDKFQQFYQEYTTAKNDKYFRLDNFIKNPAPAHVPLNEVMKKIQALFTNGLNVKANFYPDTSEIKEIYATGNYSYKAEGTNNNVNLPILLNVECYPENVQYLRLSLRGAATGDVIKGLYQIILLYLQPN